MRSRLYRITSSLIGLGAVLSCFVLFHLGGSIWQFSQFTGALVGGCVTLFVVHAIRQLSINEEGEPWVDREQLGWTLIGCGAIMWSKASHI